MISLGNLNLNNQMSLLPTKAKPNKNNQNNDLSLFKDLKSGNKQKAGDFIWSYLESVYAITYIATTSSDIAEILTIQAFLHASWTKHNSRFPVKGTYIIIKRIHVFIVFEYFPRIFFMITSTD